MFSLFALAISTEGMVITGLLAAVAFLGSKTLFRKDQEVEARRTNAMKASQIFAKRGLKRAAQMAGMYATGDYSGLMHELKNTATGILDPEQLEHELDLVFDNMLSDKLANPDSLAELAKHVVAAQAAATAAKAATAKTS